MDALVLEDRPRLVHDAPEPRPNADEVLVHVRRGGICDTDLQLVAGYMKFSGVLGHEFVGVVADDGSRLAGRRVVADINASCGRCPACLEDDGHHCRGRTVLGIHGRAGAFAERVCVPRRCLHEVPDSVSDDLAVFAEPLAAALHVLDELPRDLDRPVAVLGDGKLGLLITFALRGAGLDVVLVGHHQAKLALGAAAGANVCLESALAHELEDVPVVVEATGRATGVARAIEIVRPRGTVVLKTTIAGTSALDLSAVVVDELRIVGSRCGDMGRAIEALASGRVDPLPLIAARYPLREAERALEHAGRPGVLKVLLDMPRA